MGTQWVTFYLSTSVCKPKEMKHITQPSSKPINLKVQGQDGKCLYFRVNRNTKLAKVLNTYCKRKEVAYKAMQFLYDGNPFSHRSTPDDLEMEDGDEIAAMQHQLGGGPWSSDIEKKKQPIVCKKEVFCVLFTH